MKHLFIATAVLAILLTLWRLDVLGTALVLGAMFGVIGLYLYLQWKEKQHQDELGTLSDEQVRKTLATNVEAMFRLTRLVLPHLPRGGAIINTASTAGLRPRPGLTWYNASKGWAITATKSMAIELAPKNIRVNCICPVAGETGMLARFMGGDTPELREKFRASIPLGRLSQPLDIANAALFLVSDEAALITGVAFEVDGGRCI